MKKEISRQLSVNNVNENLIMVGEKIQILISGLLNKISLVSLLHLKDILLE